MIILNVYYKCKPGTRDAFVKEAAALNLFEEVRKEPGNLSYSYYFPIDDPDTVMCNETWENAESMAPHGSTPHVIALQDVKKKYVIETVGHKYEVVEA
jgi:quinol monooxygenase YgiN